MAVKAGVAVLKNRNPEMKAFRHDRKNQPLLPNVRRMYVKWVTVLPAETDKRRPEDGVGVDVVV